MAVNTLDPKKIVVTFGGVLIQGFADGTFVSVSPASERFSKKVGADGEVARVRSADRTYEVTITLLQTSPSNDYLSGIFELDSKGLSGGVLPLQIADLNGTSLFFFEKAWIRTNANLEEGKEIGERAWTFDTGNAVIEHIGGNLNGI